MPELIKMLSSEVLKMNKTLSSPERIMRFKLVPDEWTPCSGELSPTLKLKRKFIDNKYQHVLSEIYAKQLV
jgi:long-chain acyl-CoA synthetase